MATSQSKKALREYRREHNLCIHCGNPSLPARKMCQICTDKDRENKQRYAERDAARGICCNSGCSNKPNPGNKYCDVCNQKSTKRTNVRRTRLVTSGLCGHCGKQPRWWGTFRCKPCHQQMLATNASLNDRRIADGLCGRCGDHVLKVGYKSCQRCIDEGRARHAARKQAVLAAYSGPVCVGCGETEIVVLQIDHINGGGYKHSKEIGGTGKLYKWLQDNGYPPGFRVLCANCNVRAARGVKFPGTNKETIT